MIQVHVAGHCSPLTAIVNMTLAEIFIFLRDKNDVLVCETRWYAPDRESGEKIMFRQDELRTLEGVELDVVRAWCNDPSLPVPPVVYETLIKAAQGAAEHEMREGLKQNGLRFCDPHGENG